jgi:hypothetical protein
MLSREYLRLLFSANFIKKLIIFSSLLEGLGTLFKETKFLQIDVGSSFET